MFTQDCFKMERSSDTSLVKILISTVEYKRLLHIEKQYLELEKKSGQDVNSDIQQGQIINQIGKGLVPNNIYDFAKLVAQLLKEDNDRPSSKQQPKSNDFAQEVKHSLLHLFGQNTIG